MSKLSNEQRFKRDFIMKRVLLHLANRLDMRLAMREFRAIDDAYRRVSSLWLSTLRDEQMGREAKG
jgi:hypothetical protein